ncbi:MAG: DUF2306 domain-containing protein [Erythrobacter sp.]|nr:DUF2306 domain-containing protein [Erythrobacter sp.]
MIRTADTSQHPKHKAAPAIGASARCRLLITAAITIAITGVLSALSVFFGGFGSGEAMRSERGMSLPVMIHLATAIPALILGAFVLLRDKGDGPHRWMGRVWVILMVVTALASAFIRTPGAGIAGSGYSFIHLFTVWTLVNAPLGVWYAWQGNIPAHRSAMRGLYIGLVIAGAFTLIPGRLLGNLAFG